jgi:ABC-type cobalamin/Fe3+-siderophores transport system ATPase subunit
VSGHIDLVTEHSDTKHPARIGFVAQRDVLPGTLTVFEALLFAARLRLPESVKDQEKEDRVNDILQKLGIAHIKNMRIGDVTGGKARGISGGEMRRVTIGLELIAEPDVLLLDEPTSGLDSVSAAKVADVLYAIAHDPVNPIPIIVSIHQPRYVIRFLLRLISLVNFCSSQLYQKFDLVLLLSHGRALYSGPGSFAPAEYFSTVGAGMVPAYQQGYNVAEYLLEVASDPPVSLFQTQGVQQSSSDQRDHTIPSEKHTQDRLNAPSSGKKRINQTPGAGWRSGYATTFLTQLQYLCGREWKILKRDKTLFLTHVIVAALLGVFCGESVMCQNVSSIVISVQAGCISTRA